MTFFTFHIFHERVFLPSL